MLFEMNCIAGSWASAPHFITFSGTWVRLGTPASNEFRVYTTTTGSNKKPLEEARQEAATVLIEIPAPSTLFLLSLGGVVAARRRR